MKTYMWRNRIGFALAYIAVPIISFMLLFCSVENTGVASAETNALEETQSRTALTVEPVIERFLAQVQHYGYYPDAAESPYAERFAFFAGERLTDLCYYAIDVELTEEGLVVLTGLNSLYWQEEMEDGELLVIDMEIPEILPNRALAFTDAAGVRRTYWVAVSGEDGMPMLMEFDGIADGLVP